MNSFVFFKSRISFFVLVFLVFLAFAWLAGRWYDPDFGWHYRLGEIYSTTGIPKTDPFSFTVPHYPYIDHEWFVSFVYYQIYENFGYGFLAAIHALLAVTAPLIAFSGLTKKRTYWLVPYLLVLSSFAVRFGVRPHVFSWFLLGVFVKIFYEEKKWNKCRWFLPPLMFVWVNVHGSYMMAIVLTIVLVVLKSIKAKRFIYSDFLVLAVSVLVTLVNPHGMESWKEIIKHMTLGAEAKKQIQEWRPTIFSSEGGIFALIPFVSVFMYINRLKVRVWELFLVVGAFTAGIYSSKYVPFSVILASPFLVKYFELTRVKILKIKEGKRRFDAFYILLAVVCFVVFLGGILVVYRTSNIFIENVYYPQKAAEYLKSDPRVNNVFVSYSHGGYFIWKAPNKKYFADGRMDVFIWDAPPGESDNIFKEYSDIICGRQDLAYSFDKYKVDTVVFGQTKIEGPKNEATGMLESIFAKLGVLGRLYCREAIDIKEEMIGLNWERVYEDEFATIFLKP